MAVKHCFALAVFMLLGCQQSPQMTSNTLASGKNEIHYSSGGSGPTVVFIHGGGADQHMWQPQVNALVENFRVIIYDLRGHGKSTYLDNERYDIDDLKAILDQSGIDKAHIAGLSLGAMIAVDFALGYPEYVDKLVLMSPGLAGVQEQDMSYLGPIIELGQALQKNDTEGAADVVERITFYGSGDRTLPASMDTTVKYIRQAFTRYIESGNFTRPPRLRETVPADKLSQIAAATLVLSGDKDAAYINNNIKVLRENLPNAEYKEIPNAAHLVNIEASETVNDLLREFFNH